MLTKEEEILPLDKRLDLIFQAYKQDPNFAGELLETYSKNDKAACKKIIQELVNNQYTDEEIKLLFKIYIRFKQ